jgi:hypothetical protein
MKNGNKYYLWLGYFVEGHEFIMPKWVLCFCCENNCGFRLPAQVKQQQKQANV